MKIIKVIVNVVPVVIIALFTFINTVKAQEETEKTYIKIVVDGLSCPFCAYGLEKNFKKQTKAEDIFINVEDGYMTFNVSKETIPTEDELKKIVKDAGFTAREVSFSNKQFPKDE